MRRSLGLVTFVSTLACIACIAIACRTGEPSSEPKTPSNSPLPKIERTDKDQDPKAPPPTPELVGDAG